MTTRKQYLPLFSFGLSLTAIYLAGVFVAAEVAQAAKPDILAAAVTVDLTVVVSLLYYLLLVRHRGWPPFSVVPVFLLSLLAASFIVPEGHQDVLDVLRYLIAPAEAGLLAYLGLTVARTARRFRNDPASGDILERLRASLYDALHVRPAADVLAFEVGLLYYALFSWRTQPGDATKHAVFSYHKKNGYGSVVAGILVVMLIEMIALHVLLWVWQPTLAWVLTALSLYGLVWFLGDWRAICLRPISVEQDALIVRIGLRWTIRVPFSAIASIHRVTARPPARKTPGYLEAVLLGAPHYLITLREPIVAQGLYGLRRTITSLGLAVDDAEDFETALTQRCPACKPGER